MGYQTNQDYKPCPTCRKEIGFYETVCPRCGQTFEVDFPDERIPYIGSNVDVYLRKFNKMEQANSILSWNWCGFLFTARWLVYRKMYALGILVYAVLLIAGFMLGIVFAITGISGTAPYVTLWIASGALTLAFCAVVGMLGDYWYKNKIERLMTEGRMIPPGPEKQSHVKKGGTSIVALVVFIIVAIIIERMIDMMS